MSDLTRAVCLLLWVLPTVLAMSRAAAHATGGAPLGFSVVASGIAHATFQVRRESAESFSGHAFKVALDEADLRLVPAGGPSSRRTVEEIAAPYPAVVAINASFFDHEGRAMGLAVDGGRFLTAVKQSGTVGRVTTR